MRAKRSRLARSSSNGDTSVLSPPFFESTGIRWPVPSPAIGSSVSVRKSSPENNRPAILTLASPVRDPVDARSEGGQIGGFLEKCYYCRKRISEEDEVFMYGNLRAFCSDECREKQMDIDKDLEKLAAAPKLKVIRSGKHGVP